MINKKRLVILFLIVLLSPWYLSLGSTFSAYTKFKGKNEGIVIHAKSGVYQLFHTYENKPYRIQYGLYTVVLNTVLILPIYDEYTVNLSSEIYEEALRSDLSKLSRGFNYIHFYKNAGSYELKMEKSNSSYFLGDLHFYGKLYPWD